VLAKGDENMLTSKKSKGKLLRAPEIPCGLHVLNENGPTSCRYNYIPSY
jgi:hypothetical protein